MLRKTLSAWILSCHSSLDNRRWKGSRKSILAKWVEVDQGITFNFVDINRHNYDDDNNIIIIWHVYVYYIHHSSAHNDLNFWESGVYSVHTDTILGIRYICGPTSLFFCQRKEKHEMTGNPHIFTCLHIESIRGEDRCK